MADRPARLAVELVAVIVAVTEGHARVLTVQEGSALPAGPLEETHRTLEAGLRSWVEQRTHQPLGYVEQLYSFGDRDRMTGSGQRTISLTYIALTREEPPWGEPGASWVDFYSLFPWEDRRHGEHPPSAEVAEHLAAWAAAASDAETARTRRLRAAATFGLDGRPWNEEFALQRYELLYEAGLVDDAARDDCARRTQTLTAPGRAMVYDHRRILATGLSRLRAKIRYRPVVFELLPSKFTFLQLQQAVEALSGQLIHKQNFRRLIDQQALVEETGEVWAETGGRPARLMRFRRDVVLERAIAGTRPALIRGS